MEAGIRRHILQNFINENMINLTRQLVLIKINNKHFHEYLYE